MPPHFLDIQILSRIAKLVFTLAKILHFNPALIDKSLKAIVQPTGADAQPLGNFTLRHVRVGLQHAQYPEIGVFLKLGAVGGHAERSYPRLPQ